MPSNRPQTVPAHKFVLTALAGASLVGTIAACAPSSASTVQAGGGTQPTTAPTAAASKGTSGSHAYRDGTYSADGHYTSPNGPETVGVTLTLQSGVVTDVQITEHPTSANTRLFQNHFASGIKDVVVGKKLDDIKVGIVSGSSLTGQGFNDAVSAIKGEAS
ncbi:FMN-binding protein [Sinomonas sp. JGH33]|uniref:FMN-binding protein n=1 Tax=Sinomonas terricola TaxID=3110330 RepID=A0ABU5T8U6_9MICC|nr:FMN-binding protein [Sinomonas sp. JGH33]MEA5456082.1 FMN-binding protein [Sinomonas sp. JGH33]